MNFSTLSGWTPRVKPLTPLAVVARAGAARSLAERLLDRSDAELQQLRGAVSVSDSLLGVVGTFELLPWAPDAIYLGHDASAPALLWPIHLTPPFAPDLIERALRRQFPDLAAPLALLPAWQTVLPLGKGLPVQRAFLQRYLEQGAAV